MGTLRLGSSVVVPSVTVNTSTPPVIQSLSVTPTTSSQTITAPSGVDGYSPISVSAVDNTIDNNIQASNIKSGVTILGVTGNVVELDGEQINITPTTSQQIITPTSPKNGITQATVSAVTSSIDANIQAGNIKSGVSILGVSGTVTELNGETQSVSLTSAAGDTFTPGTGKNAITSITVTPNNENRTVNPSTSSQSLTVNSGYSGNGTITVNPVTSAIDSNITAGNIKKNISILGVTGTYEGSGGTLITKTITRNGTYNASSDNADGYSQVTVDVPGGSRLPTGYSELEYISTDGNVYINTGINLASTDVIESEFKNAFSSSSGYGALYGIYALGESSALYANGTYYGYDGANSQISTGITIDTNWHKSIHDFVNGTLQLDNTTVSFTPFTFTNSVPCGLCARYSNNNYGYYWKGSVKAFKVKRNSVLICDFVPAIRNSDNVVGMYDLVSNTFFTGTGSGTFSAGPHIAIIHYKEFVSDTNGVLKPSLTQKFNLFNITVLEADGNNGYAYLFADCTFSDSPFDNDGSLSMINGYNSNYLGICEGMLKNCTNLNYSGLSGLSSIYGFNACKQMFQACGSLSSLDFASSLEIISGDNACYEMLSDCYNLYGDIEFTSLNTIEGYNAMGCMFAYTNISSLSFPALDSNSFGYDTSQFDYMLQGCSDVTVHFPAALESTLENWSSVQDGFGGTNTTVLFDL